MSTSDSQVIARALYDALMHSTLQSLRVAADKLASTTTNDGLEQRLANVLPPDTPREVQNFILALARENALGQLPYVAREFEQYAQQGSQEALTGDITSAVELDQPEQDRITEQLRGRYGRQLELRFDVDPSLIGGLIIRIGDQVLDNSLRARLSAIQRNMQSS